MSERSVVELFRAGQECGIDVLAMDARVPSASDVYRAALRDAGVDTSGICDLASLRALHRMARERQTAGSLTFAADSGRSEAPGDVDKWLRSYGII